MMEEEKVAIDESRKIAQHEAVKSRVRNAVHAEIAQTASHRTSAERSQVEGLAEDLKYRAITEVAGAEVELERARFVARISQVVDYLFFLTYGVIGLEIVLEGLGAREGSGFKRFVDAVSAPVLRPFRGLMYDPARGPFRLMLSYMVALAVYILLHLAVNGLLRLFAQKKTTV